MTTPRVPFHRSIFTYTGLLRSKRLAAGVLVILGMGLNIFISAFGMTAWGVESRWGLHIVSMVTITVAAIAMTVRNQKHSLNLAQVASVTVLGTLWIVARTGLQISVLEVTLGSPLANAPLEAAVLVFVGARSFRWPNSWIVTLAIVSYASYSFMPSSVSPAVRDMPVTFSFVLFTCLTVTWWGKAWMSRTESKSSPL